MYLYWDEGEVCYYYLGVDLCKVSAIIERVTVNWAVASELPRVLWFEKDMEGWLDACTA